MVFSCFWRRQCPDLAEHQAQLVAGRVSHIGQIAVIARGLAPACRVFDGHTAVGQRRVQRAVQLVDGGGFETQREAVVVGAGLAIARRGDHQARAVVVPNIAFKTVDLDVAGGGCAQDAEHGVIELAAGGEVVGAEEDVGEHMELKAIYLIVLCYCPTNQIIILI